MPAVEPTVVPSRNPAVLTTKVDDETVLLDPATSEYHGLDAVGTRIWDLVDGERSVADICSALEAAYEVDGETCARDVGAFVTDLSDNGLLQIA